MAVAELKDEAVGDAPPEQIDRSAAYMARYIAKNVVASGAARRVEVQLAYAIGVAAPVSVLVDTFGTGTVDEAKISQAVNKIFSMTPRGIIETFDLQRPIYRATASGGHFGRGEFPWEKTDKAPELAAALGLKS